MGKIYLNGFYSIKEILPCIQTRIRIQQFFVAIDIAKLVNDVVVEFVNGKRKSFRVTNCKSDFTRFRQYLDGLSAKVVIGFEATGNYHRPLAYFLSQQGYELYFISSIAAARIREALYNSWDKNDSKDARSSFTY